MEIIDHSTPDGIALWHEAQREYIRHRFPHFTDAKVEAVREVIGEFLPGNVYSIARLVDAMSNQTPGDTLDNKPFLVLGVPSYHRLVVGFDCEAKEPMFEKFETIAIALAFKLDGEELVMPVMSTAITLPIGALVPNHTGITDTVMLSNQDGIGTPVSRA